MPYTFKQIAGMSVDQISDLASRGDTYREFCAAVKKAAKAAAVSDAPILEQAGEAMLASRSEKCPVCRGRGYVSGDPEGAPIEGCDACSGTGQALSPSTQHVEADVLGGDSYRCDVGVVGIVDGMDNLTPDGSYVKLSILAKNGMRRTVTVSRGAADALAAELYGVGKPSVDESWKGSE